MVPTVILSDLVTLARVLMGVLSQSNSEPDPRLLDTTPPSL